MREATLTRDRHPFNAIIACLRSSLEEGVRMRDYKQCVLCVFELDPIKSDIRSPP